MHPFPRRTHNSTDYLLCTDALTCAHGHQLNYKVSKDLDVIISTKLLPLENPEWRG